MYRAVSVMCGTKYRNMYCVYINGIASSQTTWMAQQVSGDSRQSYGR